MRTTGRRTLPYLTHPRPAFHPLPRPQGKYVTFMKHNKFKIDKYADEVERRLLRKIKDTAQLQKETSRRSSSAGPGRHSGYTGFEFMDSSDGFSSAYSTVVHVLEHVMHRGYPVDKRMASTALLTYQAEGKIQRALKFRDYIGGEEVEPWVDKILLMTQKNAIRNARHYLMKHYGKSKYSSKKDAARRRIIKEVKALYSGLVKSGSLDKYDVCAYLDCLGNLGDSGAAENSLNRACGKGDVSPDVSWANAVMAGMGVDHKGGLVMRVLEKMENGEYGGMGKPNARSYGTALAAMSYDGISGIREEECFNLLKDMKEGRGGVGVTEVRS